MKNVKNDVIESFLFLRPKEGCKSTEFYMGLAVGPVFVLIRLLIRNV